MKTNNYVVWCEEMDKVKMGQFVFTNNDDTVVRGFISGISIYSDMVEITLFEPIEVEDYMVIWMEEIVDWKPVLEEIVSKDSEIAELWRSHL